MADPGSKDPEKQPSGAVKSGSAVTAAESKTKDTEEKPEEKAEEKVEEDEGPKLPPGFMYKVICFYKYKPEEEDELCLQVGDIINVVAYDRPEDEEEGWLVGIVEGTETKGMFPTNFTKKLS